VSIAALIASEVPNVANNVKSAVDAAATYLQAAIDAEIPKNTSLGTRNFCVGFTNKIKRNSLPLKFSDLLSEKLEDLSDSIANIIQDQINHLQPFITGITNVAYIQIGLLVGLFTPPKRLILILNNPQHSRGDVRD
jgi:hypothetical protein